MQMFRIELEAPTEHMIECIITVRKYTDHLDNEVYCLEWGQEIEFYQFLSDCMVRVANLVRCWEGDFNRGFSTACPSCFSVKSAQFLNNETE